MEGKTESRKEDHIRICLTKDVGFKKSNGFDKVEFSSAEAIDGDVDISTEFLGKKLSAPLLISSMTGGSEAGENINKNLARAAEELGIAMGLGSQRATLENPDLAYTYQVRDVAPSILLFGNLGGAQLLKYDIDSVRKLVDMVNGDGLFIHINPAQELVQPEGDKEWESVTGRIKEVCKELGYPVIVKEVGCGIGGETAKALEEAGATAIDVAGAGGTSWVRVELYRGSENAKNFLEWGLPTAEALKQCRSSVSIPIIASGGIRTGEEVAKAIAMGSSLVGVGLPLLKPAMESHENVKDVIENIIDELKKTMVSVGARNLDELRKVEVKTHFSD
jgi:isopentenyl-diphosphate delta-isomerase